MATLVTGGAGYIGSHTAKELTRRGREVVVLDNLCTGHRDFLKWGVFEEGDLADSAFIDRVFEEHGIDEVVHFASFIAVGESVQKPDIYYRNNVTNTLNLLDGMVRHGVERIVFSSSAAVYGEPQAERLAEDHPLNPLSPYAWSKRMMEQVLADYGTAFGLRSVSLRYFNAAGADLDAEVGERHQPETHLIPLILAAAAGRRPSIKVFGTDYPTPDGTCLRDYIHVADLATRMCVRSTIWQAVRPRMSSTSATATGFPCVRLSMWRGTSPGWTCPWRTRPAGPGIPRRW